MKGKKEGRVDRWRMPGKGKEINRGKMRRIEDEVGELRKGKRIEEAGMKMKRRN